MTTIIAALVAVAGLACPAHMLWRMRRGEPGCVGHAGAVDDDVEVLRSRQADLAARISELTDTPPIDAVGRG